jgi:hypothetical protein
LTRPWLATLEMLEPWAGNVAAALRLIHHRDAETAPQTPAVNDF